MVSIVESVARVERMSSSRPAAVRPLVAIAGAAVLALAVGACSGTDAASEADAAAYDDADVIAMMTDAVADAGSVSLTLGTKRSPDDIDVDSSWGDEPARRALAGGDPAQRFDVRRIGSRVYVGGEVVGNQWTYLEADDPRLSDPDSGFDAGPVPTLLAIDVPGDLAALEEAVTAVSDEGADEIGGQETDRYAITVDTQTWFDGLGESSMYRGMDLPAEVTMDLYVDGDSLPVRLAYEVPDKPEESAQVGFTDWGARVEVSVPPRAKPVA